MKKIISALLAMAFAAVTLSVCAVAYEPDANEDWGCGITNFFSEDNETSVLRVKYTTTATDGKALGFKVSHTDWDAANAVTFTVDSDGTGDFVISVEDLYALVLENFGLTEIGEINWAEVHPADATLTTITSVTYEAPPAPGTGPETAPGTGPDTAPGTGPDTAPGTGPDTAPDTTPDTAPDTTPDTAPDTTPATLPSPDTGVEGIAVIAGIAIIAAGAIAVSSKKK